MAERERFHWLFSIVKTAVAVLFVSAETALAVLTGAGAVFDTI